MTQEETVEFLKRTLIIIENAEHLLRDNPPRHIPAYHKILGVQQKFERLSQDEQKSFFAQIIGIRGIIAYFLNGRYNEGSKQLEKIKKDFITIVLNSNENNKNSEI